jgi:hypothetical protein
MAGVVATTWYCRKSLDSSSDQPIMACHSVAARQWDVNWFVSQSASQLVISVSPQSSLHPHFINPTLLPAGPWPTGHQQLPIVYHPKYNITLFGIEKLHPFDSCKFEKVVRGLQQRGIICSDTQLVRPAAVSQEVLQQVHTQEYLHHLHTSSLKAAQVGRSSALQLLYPKAAVTGVLYPDAYWTQCNCHCRTESCVHDLLSHRRAALHPCWGPGYHTAHGPATAAGQQ